MFLPNRQTKLDDQVGRARFAAATGAALTVEDPDLGRARTGARPGGPAGGARAADASGAGELTFANGGAEAAAWLSGLPARRVTDRRLRVQNKTTGTPTQHVPEVDWTRHALDRARWELAAMAGRMRTLEARLAEEQQNAETDAQGAGPAERRRPTGCGAASRTGWATGWSRWSRIRCTPCPG